MAGRTLYRFGGFELDPLARELWRDGARVPIQDHPLRLLLALLRRPGEIVSRDELANALWPAGTFVDAEHGLNTAIRKLRRALGETARSAHRLETVPRRGYRLTIAVEVLAPDVAVSLAVLPPVDRSAASGKSHIAEGLAEEIHHALCAIPGLRVASYGNALRARRDTPELAGVALGVRHVLVGELHVAAERCRVVWRLIEVVSAEEIWSGRFERRPEDLVALGEEVAREVSRSIVATLLPGVVPPEHHLPRPDGANAYDHYLRARAVWRLRGSATLRAISLLERALELDDAFAPAWQTLAACYYSAAAGGHLPSREAAQRMAFAASRASALAPADAASLVIRGMCREWLDGARRPAEVAYREAIARAPELALAYGWLALNLVSAGRFEEAIAAARRGQVIDPGEPPPAALLGWALFFARRYDEALAVFRPAPDFAIAWIARAWVYERTGRLSQALDALEEGATSNEARFARRERVRVLAAMGRHEDSREAFDALVEQGALFPPFERALLALARGDRERALFELAIARDECDPWFRFRRVDPRLDALRGLPGFGASRPTDRAGASRTMHGSPAAPASPEGSDRS